MPTVTSDDHTLAARLATEAGRLLLDLRASTVREAGPADAVDGKALGRAGDRKAHELLMTALAEARPDDAVLSEEGVADPARLAHPRVWIVDPLDGTREFGEIPRVDWAVHVALVVGGRPAPRRWPWSGAMPTSTPTLVASTSGTRRHRSPWPPPRACTRPGSTARR